MEVLVVLHVLADHEEVIGLVVHDREVAHRRRAGGVEYGEAQAHGLARARRARRGLDLDRVVAWFDRAPDERHPALRARPGSAGGDFRMHGAQEHRRLRALGPRHRKAPDGPHQERDHPDQDGHAHRPRHAYRPAHPVPAFPAGGRPPLDTPRPPRQ